MPQPTFKLIKKGKLGLLFWLVTCLLGSIIIVEIERQLFNKTLGFYISFSDNILLWFVLTGIVLLCSSPVILTIYLLSKRLKNLGRMITITLILTFILALSIVYFLSKSYFEAFYLTSPYFLFAFILELFYIKMES